MSRTPSSSKPVVEAGSGRGERVRLRWLTEGDRREMAYWLEQTAVEPGGGVQAAILDEDERPIGVVGYRVGAPEDGWLSFDFVAVEPGLRGLGLESEAVRLVEEDAVERGPAHRFWAGACVDDGQGLYFWLRLGYRPARPGEIGWPDGAPEGIIAMVRVAGGEP